MASLEETLRLRAKACELCAGEEGQRVYEIEPNSGLSADTAVLICDECETHLGDPGEKPSRWHGLRDSIWSEHRPVQVLAYRVLKRLDFEGWAADLLNQVYLDDETRAWADADPLAAAAEEREEFRVVDANGMQLHDGDTVTLIKDLEVKGAGFTAKRGTTVKSISLSDDPKYVEGKVNGIQIVLVAAYLKKG